MIVKESVQCDIIALCKCAQGEPGRIFHVMLKEGEHLDQETETVC